MHDGLVTLINTPFRVEKLITTTRVEFAKYGCLITAAPVEFELELQARSQRAHVVKLALRPPAQPGPRTTPRADPVHSPNHSPAKPPKPARSAQRKRPTVLAP